MLHRYRLGLCTQAEEEAISEWYKSLETESAIDPSETALQAFEMDVDERIRQALQEEKPPLAPVSFYKLRWVQMAAVFLMALGAGLYFWMDGQEKKQLSHLQPAPPAITDLEPGGNRAVLTLADGSVIMLDSAANGSLALQGDIKITKPEDGRLAYSGKTEKQPPAGQILYNTISTPRGGQYQITLSDGTSVWLNAASSLRFPTSFPGKERKVEITGEAYLEVATESSRPFKVVAGASEIDVLGTAFNVNAYDDEATVKTTLLEGKVKVASKAKAPSKTILLLPGQQAQLNKAGQLKLVEHADMEEATAWRKGRFQFNSADIKTIMRQLARWYDMEVVYKGAIDLHFSGNLNREVYASEVFEKLAMTGEVRFNIDGKKVTVMK